MDYIYKREYLHEGDVVVVNCSHQCNIMLMDDTNFQRYKRGERFEGDGGFYTRLPAKIPVPYTGYWNVTLDLGGGSANIRHSIAVIKRP